MADNTRPISKKSAYWGVPWEDAYGYAQAIQVVNDIYVSGQLNHDASGKLVAPAALDSTGRPSDFSMMEAQMRATYDNISKLLAGTESRIGDRKKPQAEGDSTQS